jgi:hypothetical protein
MAVLDAVLDDLFIQLRDLALQVKFTIKASASEFLDGGAPDDIVASVAQYAADAKNSADAAAAAAGDATGQQWAVATGTVNSILVAMPQTVVALSNGLEIAFRAIGANTSATPTLKVDGTTARTITKNGGQPLVAGDIPGATAEMKVKYNLANTRWELLNPGLPYGLAQGTGNLARANSTVSNAATAATADALNPANNYEVAGLHVDDDLTVDGDLDVGGDIDADGDISGLE